MCYITGSSQPPRFERTNNIWGSTHFAAPIFFFHLLLAVIYLNIPLENFFSNCTDLIYRVSQEEWTKLRESVPYVELYRYNPKHLYAKLNGYGDNGQRKVWTSCISAYCTSTADSPLTFKVQWSHPSQQSRDCVRSVRWLVLHRMSSAQRDKTVLHYCQIFMRNVKCLEP